MPKAGHRALVRASRDIACRNCLLDEDQNRVKLSDFGLSKRGEVYKIPKEENTPIRWSKEHLKQKTRARSPSAESDKLLLTQQINGVNGLIKIPALDTYIRH
ncbi:hypothetical protein TELCIR_07674 [Teladorsagia circumcincta]|uniref:Protein kinase domain-containing protein n=1 Tax=Teladorsagia circumcincta TaxID=45464 RepID=A0A2G9UJP0_TELCI|nr:hypothetical protein TELCIR_07674 [Teladorsagia circumcincta]